MTEPLLNAHCLMLLGKAQITATSFGFIHSGFISGISSLILGSSFGRWASFYLLGSSETKSIKASRLFFSEAQVPAGKQSIPV